MNANCCHPRLDRGSRNIYLKLDSRVRGNDSKSTALLLERALNLQQKVKSMLLKYCSPYEAKRNTGMS